MASAAQKRIKAISYAKYGYFFILPFFIVYFFFQFWPLINTFILSFHGNFSHEDEFVGFENYKNLIFGGGRAARSTHESFLRTLGNTLILWLGNFIPQIILSLSLAVWFTDAKLKIPGKGFFKVIMYMPNIITAASVAVLFLQLCSQNQNGAVNQMLDKIGIIDFDKGEIVNFVRGKWESRGVVMFVQTWMWFGNTMIMLMSGIMGINPSLFEAANIDGASSGQVFRKITLPLLSPIMVYTVVTSMIGGLQMFDIPYLYHRGTETNAHIETIAVFIYDKFHSLQPNYGYSGAASVLLFIITLVLGSVTFYLNRDQDAIAKKKQLKKLAKQAQVQNKQFGGLGI